MKALQSFLRRLEAALTPEQWIRVREREAARLGISASAWSSLRAMTIDLVMVREAHRFASTRGSVRRADREGAWTLAASHAGKLRSQPQSFRVGDRIEPAWDHATLKQRLAELVNTTRDAAAATPIAAATALVRGLVRAQPFLGENERLSTIVASVLLRSAGLPALDANQLERDRSFADALIAPDDTAMSDALTNAVWLEALDRVESLAYVPSETTTLAAEHAALTAARLDARPLADADLASRADTLCGVLAPLLAARFPAGAARRIVHTTFEARARAATDAAYRGRTISAQQTILETRWQLAPALEAVLVVAHAGRGITGAASAHLAFELPALPTARPSPAVLLVPDEPAPDLEVRLAAWAGPAIDQARRESPLRIS